MSKILICGSRNINITKEDIDRELAGITVDKILSGGARGPDSVAIQWAEEHEVPYYIVWPDWEKHGLSAGPIRNKAMVQLCDLCLAFWDGKSRGTMNTIIEAEKEGKILRVIQYE